MRILLLCQPAEAASPIPLINTVSPTHMTTISASFDRDDPPILGANPFVGLTRSQIAAALAWSRSALPSSPAALATGLGALGDLVRVAVGRSDVEPPGRPSFRRPGLAGGPSSAASCRPTSSSSTRPPSRRRGGARPEEPRPRPLRHVSSPKRSPRPTTCSPTPTAVAKAVQTRGQSLVAGARHLAHDVRHNGGMPSQVDTRPFEVGRNLAVTPGQVVHRTEMFELIQYAPSTTQVHADLVVIPPQISKYYITDLAGTQPRRSHRRRRHPVLHAQLAQPDTRGAIGTSTPMPLPAGKRSRSPVTSPAATTPTSPACAPVASRSPRLLGHLAATGGASLVHSATFCVAGLDSTTESTVSSLMSRRAIEVAHRRSRRAGILSGDDMAKVFAWLARTTSCGTGSTTT